jgi:hypothetical protein
MLLAEYDLHSLQELNTREPALLLGSKTFRWRVGPTELATELDS